MSTLTKRDYPGNGISLANFFPNLESWAVGFDRPMRLLDEMIEGSQESATDSSDSNYLYKGIAARQFRQSFALEDHVKVLGSELKDGILNIELERDVPEEKKPRSIEIK